MKTVGERIKEKRKALGITQGDLSGPNLSRGMVSLIERNQTTPSIKTLEFIATKLGAPVSELLGESSPITEENNTIHSDVNHVKRIINMCTALLNAGRYKDSEEALEKITLSEDLMFYNGPIKKLLGIIKLQQHNYKKASELFNEALLYLSPIEGKDYISLYYYLSECYRCQGNYHLSIENALYGVVLLRSKHYKDDILLKLKIFYNLSYSYCRISEYKKGLEIISESFRIMEESKIHYSQGLFYMLKGMAELYLNLYSNSIISTRKALELLEEKKDNDKITGCLTNLGILHREIEKYDESLIYLKESLIRSEQLDNPWLILNNLYEMMLTYYKLRDFEQLERYSGRALGISKSSIDLKIKVLLVLALAKLQQEMNGEALIYVSQAEKIARETNDIYLKAKSYSVKAEIFTKQGDFKEANKLLQKSNELFMSSYSSFM